MQSGSFGGISDLSADLGVKLSALMRLIYLGENTFLFFFEFIFDHILIQIITFIIIFTKYKMSLQPSFMIRLLNAHCKWNLYFNRILILNKFTECSHYFKYMEYQYNYQN